MARIPGFHCCDPASIPGQEPEILQVTQQGQENKVAKMDIPDSSPPVSPTVNILPHMNMVYLSQLVSEYYTLLTK